MSAKAALLSFSALPPGWKLMQRPFSSRWSNGAAGACKSPQDAEAADVQACRVRATEATGVESCGVKALSRLWKTHFRPVNDIKNSLSVGYFPFSQQTLRKPLVKLHAMLHCSLILCHRTEDFPVYALATVPGDLCIMTRSVIRELKSS